MRVKFFSNYAHSEDLLKRFLANYKINDDLLTFVINDDYDYAVVFNGTYEYIRRQVKIITVIQEPSWSILPQAKFLAGSDYLIIHDRECFEYTHQIELGENVIESPAYMFYNDHVDHTFFDDASQIKKTKKLSIIVSALNYNIGNYAKRLNLLDSILQSDLEIDIYGRGFQIADSRYKGELEYKYNGLIPYEYSIAIENSNEKNYITEKFVDCIICNTIPIYKGAPNIKEVYNEQHFAEINLDSPSIIEDIKAIIAKSYTNSSINKDIYFNQYNLYTKLKDIIFGNL